MSKEKTRRETNNETKRIWLKLYKKGFGVDTEKFYVFVFCFVFSSPKE